jgi:superfamily II DNA or RNA helicase
VARALARSLLPAEGGGAPPPWLLPGQARSFRRALATLARFGGALLADPVGSGKTYVALAVAAASRGPVACLVPATLAHQWSDVARRLGVAVEIGTHQQASRGRLPHLPAGLVVIDESHHFRNPRTRRYGHVARWLLGRRVLLLSATPIVNRLDDLAHQLLLGVHDDALLPDGVVSLRGALAGGAGIPALGGLVVEDTAEAGPRPTRTPATSAASPREEESARRLLASLAQLRLSRHAPTAALIRGALLRSAASSPPALAGALRRYQGLLLHGADARRAGRCLSRAELREFAGELEDQLVLWELVADGAGELELALEDLDAIDAVLAESAALAGQMDAKLERLRAMLADGRATLVFTARRETVRHLRERLGSTVAWCTGDRAGLGHAPAARATVMRWFQEPAHPSAVPFIPLPRCLVATDVAAEGLDLRRAERVVHYDLPWTPMRLEQREGRAVRLGSTHPAIEVVRFAPPPALEAALRLGDRLDRKAALPGQAGLGEKGVGLWRWRSALVDRLGGGTAVAGLGLVGNASRQGVLAGFALFVRRAEGAEPLATAVGWLEPDGRWTEDGEVVSERLLEAARSESCTAARADAARAALDALVAPIRARLTLAAGRRWAAAEPTSSARRLTARLGELVAEAARARDRRTLERLERAMGFVGGGHTAGEAMLVDRMAEAPPRELANWLVRVPAPTPRWSWIEVRLTGVVLFEREDRVSLRA